MENLNCITKIKEIKKTPGSIISNGDFYQTLKGKKYVNRS